MSRTGHSHTSLRRGEWLHKYRIEKRLGRGGYADVYRAYDSIEGNRVALKIFRPESHVSETTFRNEVRIVSRLNHPNICALKTAEIIDGHFVLVSELGERTLFDVYARSRPARFSLRVLEQVLEGLAYAHSKGIIHRDIKPENVLAFPDGTYKKDQLDVGFLAQDVATLEEQLGFGKSDKKNLISSLSEDGQMYGLKYNKFVPMLVNAIQELSAEIDKLKA